jgi:hypothetical protein
MIIARETLKGQELLLIQNLYTRCVDSLNELDLAIVSFATHV